MFPGVIPVCLTTFPVSSLNSLIGVSSALTLKYLRIFFLSNKAVKRGFKNISDNFPVSKCRNNFKFIN